MNKNDGDLIQLDAVTKVFMTEEVETHALSGISLAIRQGEFLAISPGPSGCGKSTLLSILGLLDSPTAGTYMLNGTPVEDSRASERARIRNREIGFIFQSFNLIGDLNMFENVELLVDLHRQGSTFCIVTHDPRYTEFAQRNVHLFDGQIVDEMAPQPLAV